MRGPHNIWRLIRTGATFERTGAMKVALDAVNAALELEPRIGSLAYDVEHYFLYAPCLGGVFVHVFHFIAVALCVALVHAQ